MTVDEQVQRAEQLTLMTARDHFLREVHKRKHPRQFIINTGKKLTELVGDVGYDFIVFYAEYAGKHGCGPSARNVLRAYFTPEQIKELNEQNIGKFIPLNQLPASLEETLVKYGKKDYLRLQPREKALGKADGSKYTENTYAVMRNGKPLFHIKRI